MLLDGLHNGVKYTCAIPPIAAITDNTATVSNICDTNGFSQNEFIGVMGAIADADVTFTLLVEHGDASNLSDAAAVPDEFLLGTEAGTITAGAAVSGGAPGFADDNKTFKIGYIGPKRYFRVTLTPANNSGNIFRAGVFAQSGARKAPFTAQVA